jgi:hypothetical protein
MRNTIPLENIDEDQKTNRVTAEQIAKVTKFLRNMEA